MPLTILVDSREAKLKKYFLNGNRTNKDAMISFQGLDIGDVQLINSETNEIVYIIERKSISDFYSSINDGRYREQKARILGSVKNKASVAYIVEGNVLDTSLNLNELQRRIVQAAIVNLQLRDKITVYRTSNSVETISAPNDMPALFTRILILPNSVSVFSISSTQASSLVTS